MIEDPDDSEISPGFLSKFSRNMKGFLVPYGMSLFHKNLLEFGRLPLSLFRTTCDSVELTKKYNSSKVGLRCTGSDILYWMGVGSTLERYLF